MSSCRIPSSRGSCFWRPRRGSFSKLWGRWFKPLPRRLWPFSRRSPQGQNAPTGSTGEVCEVQGTWAQRLGKQVEQLMPAVLSGDPAFVPTFLWNYRTFATAQEVLDLLLTRYGCISPHAEEDGGPGDQQKSAIMAILDTWLDQCPQDFSQPAEFPSLRMLLVFLRLSFPGSELERQAQWLLAELVRRRERAEAKAGEPAPEEQPNSPQEAAPAPGASPEPEQAPALPS